MSTMIESVDDFLARLQQRDPAQPEFHQAVEEVLRSLWPFLEANPFGSRAKSFSGHRDGHPFLSRKRLRLAGQLYRHALAGRPPPRPLRLANPGQWRRDELRQCRHAGGCWPAQSRRGRTRESRRLSASTRLLAPGDDEQPAAGGTSSPCSTPHAGRLAASPRRRR